MPTLTFIGAGSVVFTKNLLGDILSDPVLSNATIRLHDIDPLRLETAEALARRLASQLGAQPEIRAEADRRRALDGADYVINSIQVGGYAATRLDFDIPRKYGLRQTIADTHGIGGIFRALRTIPVMLDIAADMEQVCPAALLLNYSNPMGALCRAVYEASSIGVVGLCHSMVNTTRQMAQYAGIPYDEVTFTGGGINHLAWILRFEHNATDAYPLLARAVRERRIPEGDLVRAELFQRLGYYMTESSEHVAEYLSFFIPHPDQIGKFHIPLDEYLRRSEEHLAEFEALRGQLQRGETLEIEHSVEYASQIVHAMETDEACTIYGNVRNDGWITNLPQGTCVEVPCQVDAAGIHPRPVGELPSHLAALDWPHVVGQALTVSAARYGRLDDVYHAAMLDPLAAATMPPDQIWAMVDELIEAHGARLPEGIRRVA